MQSLGSLGIQPLYASYFSMPEIVSLAALLAASQILCSKLYAQLARANQMCGEPYMLATLNGS